MNNIDIENRLKKVCEWGAQALKEEAQAILELIPQLDDNFTKAVEMMAHCHGKIIVTGVGKSFDRHSGLFYQPFRRVSWRFRCNDFR